MTYITVADLCAVNQKYMVKFPQRCLAELALYVSITNLAAPSPTYGALAVYVSNIYSPVKCRVWSSL